MSASGGFRPMPGGAGVAIGSFNNNQFVSLPTANIPADGHVHDLFPVFNPSPADWLDFTGGNRSHIIKPGVYSIEWMVTRAANFTDPTLYLQLLGISVVQELRVDPGRGNTYPVPAHFIANSTLIDVISLDDNDLPFTVAVGVNMPVDATGTVNVIATIQRLAWKP